MSENPYAASLVEHERIAPPVPLLPQEATAREVFVAWEKLRLLFNGILAAMVLLALGSNITDPRNVEFVLEGWVGANVAFCAGSVCEGYLALLGIPRRGARWFIFAVGTFVGGMLAMVALSFHAAMVNM